MELRRFTEPGLRAFEDFLDSCTTDNPRPYPESALTDPLQTEPVNAQVRLERSPVATRFALANYLDDTFDAAGYQPRRNDTNLWAWLACFFFTDICTKSRDGKWKPGSITRWIPRSNDFRRYYRHLVAGPYAIYRAHRDDPRRAMAVLCQRPGSPGDLVEQLASRQQIITNPAIMQIASDWFVDPETGKQNKHANSKRAGGARRFIDILAQFDVTWDFSMMSADALYALLPAEFHAVDKDRNLIANPIPGTDAI